MVRDCSKALGSAPIRARRLHPLLLVLALGVLPACDNLLSGDDHTSSFAIDSKIQVALSERLSPQGRALILNCRTEKLYGCFNWKLGHTLTRAGNTIQIRFLNVSVPEICQPAFGPARTAIDLGSLGDGTYRLMINANGDGVVAELKVTAGSYVVQGGDGPTIGFPAPKLNRVPDNTVWGLIGYLAPGGPSDPVAQDYLDSLEVHGAEIRILEPGDYGYFSIDQAGEIETPPNHGYYYARPYVRRFAGDPTVLRDVVKYFGKTQSQWVSIRLNTWRGDAYYGWVLGGEPLSGSSTKTQPSSRVLSSPD